jgi:hypothetical protein
MIDEKIVTEDEVEAVKAEVVEPAPEAAEPEVKFTTLMYFEVVNISRGGKVKTVLVQHDPDTKEQSVWHDPQLRVDTFTVPAGDARRTVGSSIVITARQESK